MRSDYDSFLERKSQLGSDDGFDPLWMPEFLFDFQRDLTSWALHKGRSAIFADCGLGKTPIQLVWAENVCRKTRGRVLILTPLAVGVQTIAEGEKFGIEVTRSGDGSPTGRIVVTNYERLHLFSADDFAGVVCDESSILKNYNGTTRATVTQFLRKQRYRLLCTATAAPNDYIELGTSSEALGYMGYTDMLNTFFKNDQRTVNPVRHWNGQAKWRFKKHAEQRFWRWVSSWARAVRRPSDLGYEDGDFVLPDLHEVETVVTTAKRFDGELFARPAIGLHEQRAERRMTLGERAAMVAEKVADTGRPALVWCHLNAEADLITGQIEDARQVSGADSDEKKEELLMAFSLGELRVLVTKPKIAAFGMNWQHCSHMTFFPSHSYEQYYQGVRRCWRFGQTKPVTVDIITTDGELGVLKSLRRKAADADRMFTSLIGHMNDPLLFRASAPTTQPLEAPTWA